MLKILLTVLVFLIAAEAQAACVPTSDGKQDCTYTLSWDWDQGTGAAADGFVVQQMVDNSGQWNDILAPIPITERSIVDVIKGDVGGRPIDYRIVSYNETERSDPSNTASVVTPAISAAAGVAVTTTKNVLPSRRAGSGSSIVAVLLNANDNETAIQTDKQLAVSRRADDGSSIVPILVNANETVSINGVIQ